MQNNLNIEPVVSQIANFGDMDLALEVLDVFAERALNLQEVEVAAQCYMQLDDMDKAQIFAEKALAMSDEKNPIQWNLINIYRKNAHPIKALKLIDKVQDKENHDVLELERSGCLYELNQKTKALEVLKNINQENLSPYHKQKYAIMMGNHNLLEGNFKIGLFQTIMSGSNVRNIEANNPNLFHGRKELNLSFWEGTPDCKNLIIYAEAGVGDEILNIRFMKHLAEKNINAIWYGVWHHNHKANRRTGVIELFKNSGFNAVTDISEIKNISSLLSYDLPP